MTIVKTRNSSGITLIALVLTIIVLLILAAISISMLSGENSILNRATQAKANTGLKQIDEKIKLANAAAITRGQGTLDYEVLKDELAKVLGTEGEDWTISAEDTNPWVVIVDGNEYPLSTRGTTGGGQQGGGSEDEVTELSIALTRTHQDVAPTVGGNVGSVTSENIPIPTGFYAVSGTTKAGGFVISSVQNDNLANEAGGDQFVWVPVEQNQKLSLVVKSPDDITSIKLIDPAGDEINLETSGSIGKNYSNTTITPTYNGVYTAEVTVGTEKTTETLLVRSLYAQDAFNDYFTDEKIERDEYNEYNRAYGNPDNIAVICQNLGLGENKTMDDFKAWILGTSYTDPTVNENTDLNYATSVNTNGGFYIGRFEAGSSSPRTSGNASTDVSSMTAPLSKIGVDTYNYVTRNQAIGLAEKMYTGKSYLITNAAWDRTLGWILNGNNKQLALEDIVVDSSSWGNYSSAQNVSGSLAKTGVFGSNTKVNNIYDLAGNVLEFTSATTPSTSNPCVVRGGSFFYTGSYNPASYRYGLNENFCYDINGLRVALFL